MRADRTIRRPLSTAFSLLELLVIIAIIALLSAIGGIGIMTGQRAARTEASRTILKTIETGIETFKNDLGDYPISHTSVNSSLPLCLNPRQPIGDPPTNHPLPALPTGEWTGAQWLAQAMLGLADDEHDGNKKNADMKPGPGFRVAHRGAVYGPYIDADKAQKEKVNGVPVLLDGFKRPILYYRFDEAQQAYVDDHNTGGPPDIKVYAGQGGASLIRRDYILCSPGDDGLWFCPGTDPDDGWGAEDDDIHNLE